MLSKRLQVVLDMIDIDAKLADIGCDHGYLAMHAIYKGIKKVELVDNKIGPLNVAKENLQNFTNDIQIKYSLSDGLSDIDNDINVVAICGMGGDLISKIINDNINVARSMNYLVLEANTNVYYLREFLVNNKFEIFDEEICYDRGKYYQIIKTKYNNKEYTLSNVEKEYGPILLNKKSDVFIHYIKDNIEKINKIILKNEKSSTYLNDKIKELNEVLNETNRNI